MRILLACALLLCPGPVFADCKADLQAIYDMSVAVKSFRTETLSEAGDDARVVGKFVLPGKFYAKTPAGEMIMIGKGVWMKEAEGWTRLPPGMAGAAAGFLRVGFAAGLDSASNIKCLDPVTVGGRTYDAFSFETTSAFMGAATTERVTLFADPRTHLPVLQEITSDAMGTESKTVQAIIHDRSVTISMPR